MNAQAPVSIYEFSDPVEYLNRVLLELQARNPRFSLRSWVKQLGLPHASMLSMVLARKRRLQPTLSATIGESLIRLGRLDEQGARYLDLLTLFALAKTEAEKAFYASLLASLKPDRSFSTLELDRLRVLSEWQCIAILELVRLKDFSPDPRWMARRLGGSVKESQVVEWVERLLRLELLERTAGGNLRRTEVQLRSPTDQPHSGLRRLHRQFIELGTEALEKQSIEQRDITARTVATRKDRILAAKQEIREFRDRLGKMLEVPEDEADCLYQLNVQLFELSPGENHESDSTH